MSEKPAVKLGDWITFGIGKSAVVCTVYEDASFADIEVVYLDDRNRAINEGMVWKNNKWEFKYPDPNGGYADNYDRLRSYVSTPKRKILNCIKDDKFPDMQRMYTEHYFISSKQQ